MCLCTLRVDVFTLIQQCIYCLPDEVDLCDVEAVPHSINCSRPFQLRHGESVAVMTEVEGNLCKQKQLKRTTSKLQWYRFGKYSKSTYSWFASDYLFDCTCLTPAGSPTINYTSNS